MVRNPANLTQGYGADHADIELLRLRNYTIGSKMADDELLGEGGIDRIAALLACMKPFVSPRFLLHAFDTREGWVPRASVPWRAENSIFLWAEPFRQAKSGVVLFPILV